MGIIMTIPSAIVVGLIVGALARLIVPGTKGMGIIATIGLGILGAVVGSLIYGLFGGTDTPGIDWIRLVIQVVAAAIFVGLYIGVVGRKSSV